ncbi:MAG TPA: hypothetical protein VMV36_01070 [Ignavibacteriaceae bacterium]|nr:hypothetical protein [Ignavibacteriaceae bacterium]
MIDNLEQYFNKEVAEKQDYESWANDNFKSLFNLNLLNKSKAVYKKLTGIDPGKKDKKTVDKKTVDKKTVDEKTVDEKTAKSK